MLLEMGITVVYESVLQECYFVLKKGGSTKHSGKARTIVCPELDSPKTVHLFDAKAGTNSYEPVQSAAQLVVFASTNTSSYKQTQRGGDNVLKVLYPSTSNDDFNRYAKCLDIDSEAIFPDIKAAENMSPDPNIVITFEFV